MSSDDSRVKDIFFAALFGVLMLGAYISLSSPFGKEDITGFMTNPPRVETSEQDCWDRDEDGFDDASCGGSDCNDWDDDVNPEASENCAGSSDHDCDGNIGCDDKGCCSESHCKDEPQCKGGKCKIKTAASSVALYSVRDYSGEEVFNPSDEDVEALPFCKPGPYGGDE